MHSKEVEISLNYIREVTKVLINVKIFYRELE